MFLAVVVMVLACFGAYGQTDSNSSLPASLFSLSAAPIVSLPQGTDTELYGVGTGAALTFDLRMPFMPLLFARIDLGYSYVPIKAPASLSLVNGGIGVGVQWDLSEKVSLKAFGTGGYFLAFLQGGSGRGGGNPFLSGGVSLSYEILPAFSVGLEESYRAFVGLYGDIAITVGARYAFAGTRASPAGSAPAEQVPASPLAQEPQKEVAAPGEENGLELSNVEFFNIFPVFYKYYNDHSLGRAVLRNPGKTVAENVRVSFLIKQYMDNPKTSDPPASLGPGEQKEFDLFGLFKSSVLEISQPTLLSANIIVEYTVGNAQQKREYVWAVRVQDRNAMTWEDDRRAAAFVTAKDPTVLKLSRNVAGVLKDAPFSPIPSRLLTAIGIHESLRLFGLRYSPDPTTPYSQISLKKTEIDFLQFPQNSLENRGGDCDDLSILYCALLESLGIRTAFITVPGHIFAAFDLEMNPSEARKMFSRPADLIFIGEESWLPFEVTLSDQGFLQAWDLGAREWRESSSQHQAYLYPLSECWAKYEPVGFSGSVVPIELPLSSQVLTAFTEEVGRLIDREVSPRAAALQAEARSTKDPSKAAALVNRLGILYARFGLFDLAEKELNKIAAAEYVPALINMGNICYLRNDTARAVTYYERALKKEPKRAAALLGIALARFKSGNTEEARKAWSALSEVDPELAAQYSSLGAPGQPMARQEDAGQSEQGMPWDEEESL